MIKIDYDLVGPGWFKADISNGEKEVTIFSNHFSDPVESLIDAIRVVLEGSVESRCIWQDPPGENRLIFKRADSKVIFSVLSFNESYCNKDDSAGNCVIEGEEDILTLARRVKRTIDRLKLLYGEERYEELSKHSFPYSAFGMLKNAMVKYKNEEI